VGLDDRTAQLAGSRRGHRPALFLVMAILVTLADIAVIWPEI
jgi:hypothetical protein